MNRVHQTIWVAAAQNPAHPLAHDRLGAQARAQRHDHRPQPLERPVLGPYRLHVYRPSAVATARPATAAAQFQCAGDGAIPATLAEYDLDACDGLDFYDVSMVDGSNLPMYINITKGAREQESQPARVHPGRAAPSTSSVPKALQDQGRATRSSACESACAQVRHRPVLLPGQVGAPVGLRPGEMAGRLRARSSSAPSPTPTPTSTTTPPASTSAKAPATTASSSASPRKGNPSSPRTSPASALHPERLNAASSPRFP